MSKKNITILFILILAVGLAGGLFYYSQILKSKINYLIPGVPYNGVYNLFFRSADSSELSSILDVLGYFRDERFKLSELTEKFPPGRVTNTRITDIKKFFENSGYESYQWFSAEPGNEIKEIKKFVNPEKKIPVMVYQKRSLDGENNFSGIRVVIGIFDKDKKVIVHDHDLGNNYEISFGDFEKMFRSNARAIVAVWPSDKIKTEIKGPDYSVSYPSRLETMDKVGNILISKGSPIPSAWRANDFKKANFLHKGLIADINFQYFPRAFQVYQLSLLGQTYVNLDQAEAAIKLINEQVLPLNENLSMENQGWFVPPLGEFSYPYYVLSSAYLKNKQKDLALASYKKMKEIQNTYRGKLGDEFANTRLLPSIPELEKELNKK